MKFDPIPLIRTNFHGPLVTVLTRFHCVSHQSDFSRAWTCSAALTTSHTPAPPPPSNISIRYLQATFRTQSVRNFKRPKYLQRKMKFLSSYQTLSLLHEVNSN